MEKSRIRRFYDIHYHMFNLSHPNLLAFLLRDDLINTFFVTEYSQQTSFYSEGSSFITPEINDYKQIADVLNDRNKSFILFGTDFIINLIWADSYNGYLNNFMKSPFLTDRQKELICEVNPAKFLFE